jgi:hypothetical protein
MTLKTFQEIRMMKEKCLTIPFILTPTGTAMEFHQPQLMNQPLQCTLNTTVLKQSNHTTKTEIKHKNFIKNIIKTLKPT